MLNNLKKPRTWLYMVIGGALFWSVMAFMPVQEIEPVQTGVQIIRTEEAEELTRPERDKYFYLCMDYKTDRDTCAYTISILELRLSRDNWLEIERSIEYNQELPPLMLEIYQQVTEHLENE